MTGERDPMQFWREEIREALLEETGTRRVFLVNMPSGLLQRIGIKRLPEVSADNITIGAPGTASTIEVVPQTHNARMALVRSLGPGVLRYTGKDFRQVDRLIATQGNVALQFAERGRPGARKVLLLGAYGPDDKRVGAARNTGVAVAQEYLDMLHEANATVPGTQGMNHSERQLFDETFTDAFAMSFAAVNGFDTAFSDWMNSDSGTFDEHERRNRIRDGMGDLERHLKSDAGQPLRKAFAQGDYTPLLRESLSAALALTGHPESHLRNEASSRDGESPSL